MNGGNADGETRLPENLRIRCHGTRSSVTEPVPPERVSIRGNGTRSNPEFGASVPLRIACHAPGMSISTATVPPSWVALLRGYLHFLTSLGRRASTLQRHAYAVAAVASVHPDPHALRPGDLVAYAHRHATVAALRSFLGWAHRAGHIPTNPALEAFPSGRLNGTRAHSRNPQDKLATEFPEAWTALVERYSTYLVAAGRRPGTVRQHRAHLGMLAAHHPDPITITEDDLLTYLAGKNWAPETRKSARSVLKVFFAWAVARGRIRQDDPARDLPTVRVPPGKPHPVPASAIRAAFDRGNDAERCALALAGYAGLRRAEVAAFVPSRHYDPDAGNLRVTGKGGRTRIVPVHPVVAAELDAELERRRAGQVGTGFRFASSVTVDGPLFPGMRLGEPITPDGLGEMLARVLGGHWTAHGLRHAFASSAYAGSRDLRAVQELLGHSQPETTSRYVALSDGALRAAVLSIGSAA